MLRQVHLTREDTPVHYISGPDEIAGIREAWRRLEEVVALRGRRFFGVVWPDGVYWAAVEAKPGVDDGDLAAGVIPGGAYTRSRLRGEPPEVYERIGPEMEALETATRRDPERPELEHYRRRDEIDLLVPVAQVGAPTSRGIQGAAIGRVAHPTQPPFARATDHRCRSTASSTR